MPKFPAFTYIHKMKHHYLNSDNDLMKMFTNLVGKSVIHIWVSDEDSPSQIFEDAKALRTTRNARLIKDQMKGVVETGGISTSGYNGIGRHNDATVVPFIPKLDRPPKLTPRRSKRLVSEATGVESNELDLDAMGDLTQSVNVPVSKTAIGSAEPIFECENEPTLGVRVVRRSPRKHKRPEQQQLDQRIQPDHSEQTEQLQPEPVSSLSSKAFMLRKKMPKTTARRKGLLTASNSDGGTHNIVSLEDLDLHNDEEDDPEYNMSGHHNDTSSDDEFVVDEDDLQLSDVHEMVVMDNYDPYVDDVWVDDDIQDDGEGNYFAKLYRNGEMFDKEEDGRIELRPWQLFYDKQHLRDVVRDYCIQSGFSVVVDRASNSIYTVYCSAEGCEWRLHASRLPDGFTWAIKSIQNSEHTCLGLEIRNPMVTAKWASRVLLEDIRADNDISGKTLNTLLWNRFKVQMATSTLYRVRARALIEIHGGYDDSYAFLLGYCEMIRRTNPGSDASCVFTGRGDDWCIISDRQKGIECALDKVWPEVDRRYCTKHLASNWKKAFPGPLMLSLFWKACGAYSEFTFKKAMEQMDKVGKGGRLWLAKLGDQARWTKHKFNVATKCDSNKSNFVESLNATLGIDRCRPVLTLLEGIRRNTMVRLATRRQKCEEWTRTDLCPNIVQRVQKLCQNSRTCHSYLSSAGEFEVFEGKSYLPTWNEGHIRFKA
ncbi:Sec-independent protein translocase protein TatB [Bienertia sinuspersici]